MTENIFIILAVTGGVTLTSFFLASVVYNQVKKYVDSRNGITTIPAGYEFERLSPVLEFDPMTDSVKVDGTWLSREQLENNDINNYMKNNNLAAIAHGERITTEQFNLDNDKPKKRNDVYHLKRKIDI